MNRSTGNPFPERVWKAWTAALIVAAAVGVVLPALPGPLLFDDLSSVPTAAAHGASALGNLFHLRGAGEVGYRPLRYLSLWIDWRLGGGATWWLHLSSALWHAIAAILLWHLVRRLTRDRWLSLLAALLFAVHPLQTAAVAYISGRKDLLCAVFSLLALHAALSAGRSTAGRVRLGWSALFFACWWLALQAKEMAVTIPLAALLLEAAARPLPGPVWRWPDWLVRRRPGFSGVLGIGVLLAAWKVLVLSPGTKVPVSRWGDLSTRLTMVTRTLAWHVRKLVWPWPQVGDLRGLFPDRMPGPPATNAPAWGAWWNGGGLAATVAGLVLLVLLVLLISRQRGEQRRWAVTGLVGWLLLLLPVSNLVPLNEPVAEHYQYLPMIAGALLLAVLLAPRPGSRRWQPATAMVLLLAASAYFRAGVWADPELFWRDVLRTNPGNGRAWNDLGLVLSQRDRTDEAVSCWEHAWRLDRSLVQAAANLMAVEVTAGRAERAVAVGRAALDQHPGDPLLISLQGRALLRTGQAAAAAALLDSLAGRLHTPGETTPAVGWRADRALAHELSGDRDGCLPLYAEAVRYRPDDPILLTNFGGALLEAGRIQEALDVLRRAVALPDAGGMAHRNLAVALLRSDRPQEAARELAEARRLGTVVPPSLATAVAAAADSLH